MSIRILSGPSPTTPASLLSLLKQTECASHCVLHLALLHLSEPVKAASVDAREGPTIRQQMLPQSLYSAALDLLHFLPLRAYGLTTPLVLIVLSLDPLPSDRDNTLRILAAPATAGNWFSRSGRQRNDFSHG